MRAWFLAALAATALVGCNFVMRRSLPNPGTSQAVRVESGDRLIFDLEESSATGRWQATCADPDVTVKLERGDARVRATVRVHRGFDGPTDVRFACRRADAPEPTRAFTLSLYKSTGDRAFWE